VTADRTDPTTTAPPPVPPSARVYGDCVFWLALAGMALATGGGLLSAVAPGQRPDADRLLAELLAGTEAPVLWQHAAAAAAAAVPATGLPPALGFGLAMAGIRICALAAVVGLWVTVATMLAHCERPRLFPVLGVLLALLLTLAAAGLFGSG